MTIDLTDRYDTPAYFRGDRATWVLDRRQQPVRAIVIHHTAGWYGAALAEDATETQERAQIDALAVDHRARFGIGPGYHYLAFPSGQLYAAGKWGTHRAHAAGREPASRIAWNHIAIGVCAFGDYEATPPSARLVVALREAIAEVRRLAGAAVPVYGHGTLPTVNAGGIAFSQATACPGRLLAWLDASQSRDDEPLREALTTALTGARERINAALRLLERSV